MDTVRFVNANVWTLNRLPITADNAGTKAVSEKGEKWIQAAIKKPGALRKQLGVKKGAKIPAGKLQTAAEKGGKLGKRASMAKTLKTLGK